MIETNRHAGLPLILIVEGNPFFARDLADSVLETLTICDVVTVAELDEAVPIAEAARAAEQPIPAVIVHAPTAQIVESGLAHLVSDAGGRIIVVEGDEPPERIVSRGWKWLAVPITPELIRTAITGPMITGPTSPSAAQPD